MPHVSIITPAYNEEALIGQAMASVLAQTYQDWEWLVIDDGSTDRTPAIVEAANDPRIRLIHSGQQAGASAARNLGIGQAGGEYIAFLDADDTWLPEKLARQVDYLQAEQLPGCISHYGMRTLRGHERIYRLPDLRRRGWQERLLRKCDLSIGSTFLVLRSVFEEVGLFNTDLQRLEDWEWLWRYLAIYDLGCVQEILVWLEQSPFPSADRLLPAVTRIKPLMQAQAQSIFGSKGVRMISAALAYERAALARHDKNYVAFAKALLACGLLSPTILRENVWERLQQPA